MSTARNPVYPMRKLDGLDSVGFVEGDDTNSGNVDNVQIAYRRALYGYI